MKKQVVLGVTIVLLLAIAGFAASFFICGQNMGLPDDRLCFDMSMSRVRFMKGAPIEKIKSEVTPEISLYYGETVYGYPAAATYDFFMSGLLGNRLTRATYTINNIDYDSAAELFDKIVEDQTETLNKEEGFFVEDNSDKAQEKLSVTIGTDTGSIGISFDMEYDNSRKMLYFSTFNLK